MTSERAKQIALSGMSHRRLTRFQKGLQDCLDVQCSNGNWNYSPYMLGLANGMILARSILTGEEAQFLDAPEEWLQDRHCDPEVTSPVTDAQLLLAEVVTMSDETRGQGNQLAEPPGR